MIKKYFLLFSVLVAFTSTPSVADAEQFVKIISPNGGETFQNGDQATISWEPNEVSTVAISLSTGPGSSSHITSTIDASLGSYTWTINKGAMVETNYKIKITGYPSGGYGNPIDESDDFFSILNTGQTQNNSDEFSLRCWSDTPEVFVGDQITWKVDISGDTSDYQYYWSDGLGVVTSTLGETAGLEGPYSRAVNIYSNNSLIDTINCEEVLVKEKTNENDITNYRI
jgi:hypothetical protein